MKAKLDEFVQKHMKQGGRFVPARLQAALALLEKLRGTPSLDLDDHMASKGSAGLQSHETFGDRAHKRLRIEPINKNHGRRSSSLQEWGQELLDVLREERFEENESARVGLLGKTQRAFGKILRGLLTQAPLEARIARRSAETVIKEILKQAEVKKQAGSVAQYLVGAKLMLRFKRDIPVHPASKSDRKSWSDRDARSGDFELEDAVIEVAVGLPDEKHIRQIVDALKKSESEVWLLTHSDRAARWRKDLDACDDIDSRRVVVASVEAFIGQNISELGQFSAEKKTTQLHALFRIYNDRWVQAVGTPGIRVAVM